MTRSFIAALAAATALAGAASAQDHDHHGGAPPRAAHAAPARAPGRAVAHAPGRAVAHAPGRAVARGVRGPGARPGGGFVYGGRPHAAIRGPAFAYPPGYGYRRWAIGGILPGLFLAPQYYFTGYAAYGFGPPGPGLVWVRYGPDLLLVGRRTGRIRQVVYGVFL